MVIVGHQIQYSTGSDAFFDDPVYKLIYSFHMPLFMFVSGYFYFNSVNKHSSLTIIKNKAIQLILPIITFTITCYLLSNIYSFGSLLENGPKNILNLITGNFPKKRLFLLFLNNLWFLWIVFYLSCLTIVIRRYLKDSILVYILLFLSLFFCPDSFIRNTFCFMYPYFVTGYLMNKYNLFKSVFYSNKPIIDYSIIILFFILLLFYNKNTYIYTTGYCIIGKQNQLYYDMHRLLIGFCGIYTILWSLLKIKDYKLNTHSFIRDGVLYLGKNTKQLYIITTSTIFINILNLFATGEVNYLKSLIATIIIIIVSILIIEFIKRFKILNLIIFGQWTLNKHTPLKKETNAII